MSRYSSHKGGPNLTANEHHPKMASYLVLSYDHDSSSSIRVHAHTCDRESAIAVYETVLGFRPDELVELLLLSDEFECVNGADVFWGNHAAGCGKPDRGGYQVIRSNNREPMEVREGESLDEAKNRAGLRATGSS